MENLKEAQEKILKEFTEEDVEVRGEFLKLFRAEVIKFSEAMAEAFLNWRTLDAGCPFPNKVYLLVVLLIRGQLSHIKKKLMVA